MMLDHDYPQHLAAYAPVLEHFGPGRRCGRHWYACCPAHTDEAPSLSFWLGQDGRLMMGCHAGCPKTLILRAVGLEWKHLFPPDDAARFRSRPVATYPYRDGGGRLLYQVVRYEWDAPDGTRRKRFVQRHPVEPGPWSYDMTGVQRVLYRLPELLAAPASRTVLVVEGEKDADAAWRVGLAATTNAGGARAPWLDEYSEVLSCRDVVVIPDGDAPGLRHGDEVAGSLLRHDVRSVRVAGLPGGKDLSALLGMMGGMTVDQQRQTVVRVLGDAPQWRACRRRAAQGA